MTRLLVVIPTTAGPAILRRLSPRAGLPVSAAFADGDYRPLGWSADYARLTAAGGPIARALRREAIDPHELRLEKSFDAGRSWEAPVSTAHLLLATGGFELTDRPEDAEVLLWTTGAVDLELKMIEGEYAIPEKLERSRALFDAAAGAKIIVAPPPGAGDAARSALAGRANARVLDIHTAPDVARAARSAIAASAPSREDAPAPARKRIGVLPIAAVAALVAIVAAGATVFGPALMQKPDPAPAPQPVVETPPEKTVEAPPPPQPPVAIVEVRAPQGATCAQVLFGAANPIRKSVEPAGADAFTSTRYDATLCGVAIRPVDPKSATAKVAGDLASASSAPKPEMDGGFLYMLRAGAVRKVVYQVQAVAKDGRSLATLRHELDP